jgi:hypothetical protein
MFIPEGVDDVDTWHQLTPSDSTAHAAPATRDAALRATTHAANHDATMTRSARVGRSRRVGE